MASVACCLLGRQVFLTDLCPAGEKRVKFEGEQVSILHSPLPGTGEGSGGVSGIASGPATGLFNQSPAETISSKRKSSDLLILGF